MATGSASPRSYGCSSGELRGNLSSPELRGNLSPTLGERVEGKRNVTIASNFIKGKTEEEEEEVHHDQTTTWSMKKKQANRCMNSSYVSNLMTLVILVDAVCTIADIDYRAIGQKTPAVYPTISNICLGLYTAEVLTMWILRGRKAFRHWTMRLDIVIIMAGFTELALDSLASDIMINLGFVPILRMVRVLRLARLLKRLRAFRELQKLVRMMATCLRALFWSFVFCFMIMTVWAMLIVEFVHPIMTHMDSLASEQICQNWPACSTATSGVMEANLLLFKTVIAGDSWGEIAVPVIREYPATAIIFCGSLLTLVFGVLNLIVAVVVDTFAEARQRDVLNLAEELEYNLANDVKSLEAIFQRIDTDGSGEVTFEELLEGARRDPQFQSRLRVMDIDEADLQQLFEMIDTTGEGQIRLSEFVAPLSRWVHDSKTATRFIKYNVLRALHQQEEIYAQMLEHQDVFTERMAEMQSMMSTLFTIQTSPKRQSRGHSRESSTSSFTNASTSEEPQDDTLDQVLPRQLPVVPKLSDSDDEPVVQPPVSQTPAALILEAPAQRSAPFEMPSVSLDKLDDFVMATTEAALRKCMVLVETALQERVRQPTIQPRKQHRTLRSSLRERRGATGPGPVGPGHVGPGKEAPSGQSSLSVNSFDKGASYGLYSHSFGQGMPGALSTNKSVNKIPRRPLGSFAAPGSLPPSSWFTRLVS